MVDPHATDQCAWRKENVGQCLLPHGHAGNHQYPDERCKRCGYPKAAHELPSLNVCSKFESNENVGAKSSYEGPEAQAKSAAGEATSDVLTSNGVILRPVVAFDTPDAHSVQWKVGNQTFDIGPDHWETKEEAEWFAEQFQKALASYKGSPNEIEFLRREDENHWKARRKLLARLDTITRTREQERDYADVCYENQQLRARLDWLEKGIRSDSPRETPAAASNERLDEARDAVRSLVAFAYEAGFHELGYAPEEVVFDEIDSLNRRVEQLEDTLLKLAAQRGHVETTEVSEIDKLRLELAVARRRIRVLEGTADRGTPVRASTAEVVLPNTAEPTATPVQPSEKTCGCGVGKDILNGGTAVITCPQHATQAESAPSVCGHCGAELGPHNATLCDRCYREGMDAVRASLLERSAEKTRERRDIFDDYEGCDTGTDTSPEKAKATRECPECRQSDCACGQGYL